MAPFKRRRDDSKSKKDYGIGSKKARDVTIIQNNNGLATKDGLRSVAGSESVQSNDNDGTDVENGKLLSEEEDIEIEPGLQNSYNNLLQALTPNARHKQASRKARKHGLNKPPEHLGDSLEVGGTEEELGDLSDPEIESEPDSEIEGNEQPHDSFAKHYVPLDQSFKEKIQAIRDNKWFAEKDDIGNLGWVSHLRSPGIANPKATGWPRQANQVHDLNIRHKFQENATKLLPAFEKPMGLLASTIFDYRDVMFSGRSTKKSPTLRSLVSIHVVNHIFKTRNHILKNNARLVRVNDGEDLELRDQGFTRPKVLVLLPTRQSCVEIVDTIMTLCQPEQQENKRRFQDTYMSEGKKFSEDKPDDFKHLFGGNDDDMFRLGIKFTRKSVKFFSQFYNSDIILASPLGLRMVLEGDKSKKQDCDFLSSIEIVVVDQSEALLMQNWEHVEYIFERLNLEPKEAHGCDFSRVRNWYLDGDARYLRQTILFSAFNFPSLNKLYTQNMLNVTGKLKISRTYNGAIETLGIPVKQSFLRFDAKDAVSEPDDRFNYFATAVLPSIIKHTSHDIRQDQGVLLYVPVYADFVRVRNYLAASPSTQNTSFGSISEYTSVRDVARTRSHFSSGRYSILLYTERAHHFRRYRIRGVRSIVFYGLPENSIFYEETVGGFLGSSIVETKFDGRQASVRSLFSRFDVLKLERIVGTRRYLALMGDSGDTFNFT